jgi:hypothetical protein
MSRNIDINPHPDNSNNIIALPAFIFKSQNKTKKRGYVRLEARLQARTKQ